LVGKPNGECVLLQQSYIVEQQKTAIESIQNSATAGAMAGNAASKKQPTFEQLSLANISLSIVGTVPLNDRILPNEPTQHRSAPGKVRRLSLSA
jgi:hypothetical protein